MKALQPELNQAAHNLGNALKDSPPLRARAEALAAMVADQRATALLDDLQRAQAEIRLRQSNGSVIQADLARLRQLQNEVQSHPTIAAFMDAESAAKAYLPQVNRAISDLLGIDFAALGQVSGCC